jgi:hypothetical protein
MMKRNLKLVSGFGAIMALVAVSGGTAHADWSTPTNQLHLQVRATSAIISPFGPINVYDPEGQYVEDTENLAVTSTWINPGGQPLPTATTWNVTHNYSVSVTDGLKAQFDNTPTYYGLAYAEIGYTHPALGGYRTFAKSATFGYPYGPNVEVSPDPSIPLSGSEVVAAGFFTSYTLAQVPTCTLTCNFTQSIRARSIASTLGGLMGPDQIPVSNDALAHAETGLFKIDTTGVTFAPTP